MTAKQNLYTTSTMKMYSTSLHTAILRFEAAVRAHEFRGGAHPGDVPEIDAEYRDSRDALDKAIIAHAKRQYDSGERSGQSRAADARYGQDMGQ